MKVKGSGLLNVLSLLGLWNTLILNDKRWQSETEPFPQLQLPPLSRVQKKDITNPNLWGAGCTGLYHVSVMSGVSNTEWPRLHPRATVLTGVVEAICQCRKVVRAQSPLQSISSAKVTKLSQVCWDICNPRTQKVEAGRSHVWGQPGLDKIEKEEEEEEEKE